MDTVTGVVAGGAGPDRRNGGLDQGWDRDRLQGLAKEAPEITRCFDTIPTVRIDFDFE